MLTLNNCTKRAKHLLTNAITLPAFSTKINQIRSIPIFEKKVKGIVYSDKSMVSFFPPDLKSRSPNLIQPRQRNIMYSYLSTELFTNSTLTKKRTIKNLFWVVSCDTPLLHFV